MNFFIICLNGKKSIKVRPGNFDENMQARMFLSHQTFEGMKISIYSMIALTKFLLGAGLKFVSTNHFCQDPVEQYLGKQRGIGRSDNPTMFTFGYNDNKIGMYRGLMLKFSVIPQEKPLLKSVHMLSIIHQYPDGNKKVIQLTFSEPPYD